MTGYSKEEVIGKVPRFLQGKKTDRKILDLMKKELAKKGIFRNEIINYRKDGKEYHIEWHVSAVRDDEGNIINWMSIQRDITERKKLEEQLRKEKKSVEQKVIRRTAELEKLKDKLEMYSRKLEKKIKTLENKGIGLNDNEKKVFLHITKNPLDSDLAISLATGLRRPTVTSIRNRLLLRRWYKEIFIPDIEKIGVQILAITFGKDAVPELSSKLGVIEKRFRGKETVMFLSTHQDYFSISMTKDFSTAKNFEAERDGERSIFIPLSHVKRFSFLDFYKTLSGILQESPGEADTVQTQIVQETKKIQDNLKDLNGLKSLKDKDKRIILEMIKEPFATARTISERASVSLPKVLKTREMLLTSGMIRKAIVPDFKRLGGHIVIIKAEYEEDGSKETQKAINRIRELLRPFIDIEYEKGLFIVSLFRDYPEQEAEITDELEKMYEEGELRSFPEVLVIRTRQIRFSSINTVGIYERSLLMNS